ncbi:aspartate aminotransferase [Tepiditoga spiralis]|uniref:Aspartate aminotransferase n=1 Tax=Tepiditoga spiralis TaxID=2108365 RepID=A0A7G1GAE4_9BACT|nr:aspartate aminotransferase [Tepiditoga spiralis]BBE32093.1 aspartate aminotransferase [Tepiditoga spiralis]
MNFSKKVLEVTPSITLELNSKAIELEKQGIDIVKLTAGEPDFPTPNSIIEAAYKAMKEGKTKYTNSSGIIELRKKISEYIKGRTNIEYKTNQIVVSNGGKQALYNVLLALLNEKDEVIIFDPCWVSYEAQIKIAGGNTVHVSLKEENNFLPTEEQLRKAITSKTKAILINSPNNPTGTVYPLETLKMIAKLSKEYGFYVISDEVYELLVYEGKHYSIVNIDNMIERTIIINALSKTWSMTGWRVGYCVGPEDLIKQVSKIQSHTTSNINTPAQYAALAAFDVKDEVEKMYTSFKERKEYVSKELKRIGLKFVEPAGAFYFFINIKEFGIKDTDFAKQLLDEVKLAVVPGSGFFKDGFIRISFATSKENLKKALERLESFVNKLRG